MDDLNMQRYHSVLAMVIGFSGSFFMFAISLFFSYSEIGSIVSIGQFLEEVSVALYLFACTVQGLSLTEQKKTMPAAGFTMMAIAQGVIFGTYFEPNNTEGNTKAYDLASGGLLLFFPAMFLISFYTKFPRWVNALGIICCVPYLVDFIIFIRTEHYSTLLDNVYLVAQSLLEITALIWAFYIWRNYKHDLPASR